MREGVLSNVCFCPLFKNKPSLGFITKSNRESDKFRATSLVFKNSFLIAIK